MLTVLIIDVSKEVKKYFLEKIPWVGSEKYSYKDFDTLEKWLLRLRNSRYENDKRSYYNHESGCHKSGVYIFLREKETEPTFRGSSKKPPKSSPWCVVCV